tara:strand:+ start:596 stop:1696 length:1101 start_codon:yes stop_codon:yes gene_type:complete
MMKNKLFSIVALTSYITFFIPCSLAADFNIFGDVALTGSDNEGTSSKFVLGDLDLFVAHKINEKTFAMLEMVFEKEEHDYNVDIERLWIKHVFSDQFSISAGRFHAPLGYWNSNFHHGTLLQDTTGRPFFLDFEDGENGILPVHTVGLMTSGFLLSDTESWKYKVIIGNGPSLNSSNKRSLDETSKIEVNDISDKSNNKSIVARFTYQPENSHWALGVFTNIHNIIESSDTGLVPKGETLIKQKIFGTDFQWNINNFNILAETFILQHEENFLNNTSYNSLAFYVQGGYKIKKDLKIIYRYSDLNFDNNDIYFQLMGTKEQSHHVVTLKYDFDHYNSLKLEYNKQLFSDPLLSSNSYTIQWSFMIP